MERLFGVLQMSDIDINKVRRITGDYNDWLMKHLQDKEAACAHLQVALEEYQEDHDKEAFMLALKNVANAQGGISKLAKETNLNREHLYRVLSGNGNPTIETLVTILKAFGVQFKLEIAA